MRDARIGSAKKSGFPASTETGQGPLATENSTAASKGPLECPVCRLSFGGRQGHWERQNHIQQCLESLQLFDSEG